MLVFTARGGFVRPRALQIRVHPGAQGLLSAGAPVASEAMSADAVEAEVRAFADPGGRGVPVRSVVLSGTDGWTGDLDDLVARCRRAGATHVTVHGRRAAGADALATLFDDPSQPWVPWTRGHHTAVVPLTDAVVAALPEVVPAVADADRLVLTWPFPPHGRPAPVAAVDDALTRASSALAQRRDWALKGLPACALPRWSAHVRPSRNRWYVDAAHRGDDALLFVPGVLAMAKVDACRACPVDGTCDGAPAAWRDAGKLPPLRPLPAA